MVAEMKLARRWNLLVLRELLDGPRRFSELHKALPQAPAKSLTRALAKLEQQGMVQRKVDSTRPPRVSYSMDHNDPILREVINALSRWGTENHPSRKAAH